MRTIFSILIALFLTFPLSDIAALAGAATNDKWNEFAWAELKPDDQANWRVLGWTEQAWDSGNSSLAPASEAKSWSALTGEEQQAAAQLGYTKSCWDE